MDEPERVRITVEHEVDWIRVQDNLKKGLQQSLEGRLASLPGGKDGPAAKKVRRELEGRLRKVTPFFGDTIWMLIWRR